MKDETLKQIKEEYFNKKTNIQNYNNNIKKIRKLEKDEKIKEYIELRGIDKSLLKYKINYQKEIIKEIINKYLTIIKHDETNNIYVFLGTFHHPKNNQHHNNDILVEDSSPYADYKEYINIEENDSIFIPVSEAVKFESENFIIRPPKNCIFYDIQEYFFEKAIKSNQEKAKVRTLNKYNLKKDK